MRKVAAVVVAYNREVLLGKCLAALQKQTVPLQHIVVVDNASTDNSLQVAKASGAEVVSLQENTGGAGGFTAGIASAMGHDVDFLWLMDDDTIPFSNALEELLQTADAYPGAPAFLCSKAEWFDGQVHPMNTHRRRPFVPSEQIDHAKKVGAIQVRSASFVSVLIDTRAVREEGLPIADYFIWNDDLEYLSRIGKNRVGLYVPSSRVLHATKKLAGVNEDPRDRFFYEVRNKIWFLRLSTGLHLMDRVLYGASCIRRWAKMFSASADRPAMVKVGWSGLKAGMRAPRSNREVFASSAEVGPAIAKMEHR
ncbi:glycosyltransferase [Winkia sp. UMB6473-AN360BR]|uniref:glycosyltransferase n=1 Tax=Winkia sp. UMB6473-AN360BR TaxID=3050611 RepID=UPI002552A5FD|nr:glycosyltransferase [Winkia sp. UMB6473-AN360BR]MDK8816594.1 glycosyltransferase [Winkia sp. UMB6473-AN360BR]